MQPLPPNLWDPSLQHIVEAMNGRPLEIHCLLANNPALLSAWWNYRMHSVSGGELGQRNAELVILRVAVHMQSWYEWAAHVARGHEAGLSTSEIQRVAIGTLDDGWSDQDSALLTAVDALVTRHQLDAATLSQTARFFSDRQMLEIISLQGMYVTIAGLLNTWPVNVEDHVLRKLPEGFTEHSFRSLLSAAHSN